jgi:hypothetical protein
VFGMQAVPQKHVRQGRMGRQSACMCMPAAALSRRFSTSYHSLWSSSLWLWLRCPAYSTMIQYKMDVSLNSRRGERARVTTCD